MREIVVCIQPHALDSVYCRRWPYDTFRQKMHRSKILVDCFRYFFLFDIRLRFFNLDCFRLNAVFMNGLVIQWEGDNLFCITSNKLARLSILKLFFSAFTCSAHFISQAVKGFYWLVFAMIHRIIAEYCREFGLMCSSFVSCSQNPCTRALAYQ